MTSPDLFAIHLENTRALDKAFNITARECRKAIARQDDDTTSSLTKTCIFIFGARMENRLFRLLYEPTGFTKDQQARILGTRSIEDSWTRTVTEAFAARNGISIHQVPRRLGFTDKARHDELIRLIQAELAPIITLRNVLGHGQWYRALTPDRSQIDPARMRLLATTRLWHLTIKANMLEHLVWLLHDLAVTHSAFERDFDKRWKDLQAARHRLDLNHYQKWEATLISKYQKGRARRTEE